MVNVLKKFNYKKKYGQNFLKNISIIEKIVTSISPSSDDLIIEIGPGAGAITKKLKDYGSPLIAFEIDEETKQFLLPLEDEKTHIEYADFLELDLKSYLSSYTYRKLFIVGNLPYYITTPIVEHIIDSHVEAESITIMVQKEVAERFLAKPKTKEYGYMTVLLNYHFAIEKITDVPKSDFIPAPKVDSTVLKLKPKKNQTIDYEFFKKLLKSSFQFKRKTLGNNLKAYDREKIQKILEKHGLSFTNRAEEIDLEIFLEISDILSA